MDAQLKAACDRLRATIGNYIVSREGSIFTGAPHIHQQHRCKGVFNKKNTDLLFTH
jgi:hypothetical protein